MKRRFQFRLARLMRVRELAEREARGTWGVAEGQAREAELELERRVANMGSARNELAAARRQGRLNPGELLALEKTLGNHELGIQITRERLRERRAKADELRRAWRDRQREHAALENLEERQREEHRMALDAHESAQLDEVASRRHSERRAG